MNNTTTNNHSLALSHVRRAYPSATIIAVAFDNTDDTSFLFTIDHKTTVIATSQGGVEDVTNKVVVLSEEVGMASEFYPETL